MPLATETVSCKGRRPRTLASTQLRHIYTHLCSCVCVCMRGLFLSVWTSVCRRGTAAPHTPEVGSMEATCADTLTFLVPRSSLFQFAPFSLTFSPIFAHQRQLYMCTFVCGGGGGGPSLCEGAGGSVSNGAADDFPVPFFAVRSTFLFALLRAVSTSTTQTHAPCKSFAPFLFHCSSDDSVSLFLCPCASVRVCVCGYRSVDVCARGRW